MMASRMQQDSFIEDSDETCPLCVEEFDIQDRNFRPCPCGYQVCQFCFNNIKNNMNGLCPACRRPYNDETIEWKVISQEEFKADLQKQARKKAEQRQKEAQKREAESLNRKHLAGLRVVQKNLVYVVGLNPRIREEDLLHTLRGQQYFGQYGKIVKIVVSKSKDGGQGSQPLGVYVTFARKEDAEKCIAAVDGSENGGRVLRAQYGTTKYCSAYLRNETCANKNCMFLHEPGEEKDSFTRQDLSSINVISIQRPAQPSANTTSSVGTVAGRQGQSRTMTPHPQPVAQQAPHPVHPETHTMGRDLSKEGASPTDSGDGSALPSSASWAARGMHQQSRRASRAATGSTPSPKVDPAILGFRAHDGPRNEADIAEVQPGQQVAKPLAASSLDSAHRQAQAIAQSGRVRATPSGALLDRLLKSALSPNIRFAFAKDMFSPEEYEALMRYPPLIDVNGGAKLRARRDADALRKREETVKALSQAAANAKPDEAVGSGSLQLGGEPEARQERRESNVLVDQGDLGNQDHHQPIQPPSQNAFSGIPAQEGPFGPAYSSVNALTNLMGNVRGLATSEQAQQPHLAQKSNNAQPGSFFDQFSQNFTQQPLHPDHLQQTQPPSAQGHARQTSRFAFANESSSSTATVKTAANAKIVAQQVAMMPSTTANHSHMPQNHQPYGGSQYYGGTTPIPPPGLKSAGTTPVSSGGFFGHGQAFGSSFASGSNVANSLGNVENKPELPREMIRTRGTLVGTVGGHGADAGKPPSASESRPNPTSSSAAAGLVLSSVRPIQPKTLRLIPTPKTETPPPLPSIATSTTVPSPTVQLPSQKPSGNVSSHPATPAGDVTSDNASQVSASLSRASSPPLSKVASGSLRSLTKSQMKRQRRDAKKELEKKELEEVTIAPVVEEKEIAPIIGKKKKKAKQKNAVAEDTTPSISRPPSPVAGATASEKQQTGTAAAASPKGTKESSKEEELGSKTDNPDASIKVEQAKAERAESVDQYNLTPCGIIEALASAGNVDVSELAFFKPVTSVNHRREISSAEMEEVNRKFTISDADQAKLAEGIPVHHVGPTGSTSSRVMISPGGYVLRGLSSDLEQRFLELEKSVAEAAKSPAAFRPARQGSDSGFYMIGGRVVQSVPATPTTTTTTTVSSGSTDPLGTVASTTTPSNAMSKVRLHEALNYINQFVLPVLPSRGKFDATTPFSFKMDDNGIRTGTAPDPATYTTFINHPSSSSPTTTSTAISSEVAGVVHGMVSGLTSATTPTTTTSTPPHRVAGSGSGSGSAVGAGAIVMGPPPPPPSLGGLVGGGGGAGPEDESFFLSRVPLLSVDAAESAWHTSKRETEAVEKRLNALIKKNRRLAIGASL